MCRRYTPLEPYVRRALFYAARSRSVTKEKRKSPGARIVARVSFVAPATVLFTRIPPLHFQLPRNAREENVLGARTGCFRGTKVFSSRDSPVATRGSSKMEKVRAGRLRCRTFRITPARPRMADPLGSRSCEQATFQRSGIFASCGPLQFISSLRG